MDTLGPFKGINRSIIPIINGKMEHKLKLVSISIGSRFRKTRGPFFGCLMIRIDILIFRSLACVPPVSGKIPTICRVQVCNLKANPPLVGASHRPVVIGL